MAPPKKKEQQKMSLGDFLGDQSLGSWADEMEDTPIGTGTGGASSYGERRAFQSAGPGGFGGSSGGFERNDRGFAIQHREELPLPSRPPYTAHLGNLSFDATEGDVGDFFSGCEVTNVRIVEDKLERKPKGFGYVEFGSVDGLKKALELSGTQFQGRNIRVSVAEPPKDRAEQKDMSDWSRKGPLPDLPGQGRRVSDRGGPGGERSGGYRAYDQGSDAGGERRRPAFESDGKVRDFGNWERKGPLSPSLAAAAPREGGRLRTNDGPGSERRQSPAWGGGSQDGSRPPRREFQDRPQYERQPTAPEMDSQWRTKMRPDAAAQSPSATPETSTPSSPQPHHAAPSTRPRLNLAKRTLTESEPAAASTAASTAASESKSNPFGAARPIDTAAREKEIEEKRLLAIRQKKEADDKAREEKRAKQTADKAAADEKSAAAASTPEKPKETEGEEKPVTQILKREGDENAVGGEEEAPIDAPANGTIVDDKAVKPKEIVRDPPKTGGGSWRKSSTPATPTETTAEKVEDDGWNTVPVKGGKNKGPRRAIAS